MNKVNELSDRIKKMPMHELLNLAAMAFQNELDDSKIDFIVFHLEARLQERRIFKQYGVKPTEQEE